MNKISVFDIDYSLSAERWEGFVNKVLQENVSVGALLRSTRGVSWWCGVLTIENIGTPFVIQMLKRPHALNYLKQAAQDYFTVPVTEIVITDSSTEAN